MNKIIIICNIKKEEKYLVNKDNTKILFFVDLDKYTPIMKLKEYLKNEIGITLSMFNKSNTRKINFLGENYKCIIYDITDYIGEINSDKFKFVDKNEIVRNEGMIML